MEKDAGSRFIRDNFEPGDRLAVVLIERRSAGVTQRIAPARRIASPEFQAWLKDRNRMGADVFVSMNALHEHARGRTRADVAVIRHLYLDFDSDGTNAVERMQSRQDMPKPNYLVNTSPDHWQASWRVQGFGNEQAEEMMRGMVREFGADPAATDSARVMRIPGFLNHKRHPPHLVRGERLAHAIYSPDQFPRLQQDERSSAAPEAHQPRTRPRSVPAGHFSQSELDWAYAKRALARGESPESVIAAIVAYRQGDKSDPEYYARLTVNKAAQDLSGARERDPDGPNR
jgi:hypothetical protein